MRHSRGYLLQVFLALCCLSLFLAMPAIVGGEDIPFDASYTAAPNGDVKVVYKFTPSMAVYQQLRDSISNLYLLLRGLASSHAEIEVADKKADWDDSKRTLTFSFKVLGQARNMGNRWEIDILPGVDFINCNEATRTLFFNEESVGPLGQVRGVSKLHLPEGARDFGYDDSRRVVKYALPAPKKSAGGSNFLIIAGLASLILGAFLTAASFFRKSAPAAAPAAPAPQTPQLPMEEASQKLLDHEDK